jgi:hypothetical protein
MDAFVIAGRTMRLPTYGGQISGDGVGVGIGADHLQMQNGRRCDLQGFFSPGQAGNLGPSFVAEGESTARSPSVPKAAALLQLVGSYYPAPLEWRKREQHHAGQRTCFFLMHAHRATKLTTEELPDSQDGD